MDFIPVLVIESIFSPFEIDGLDAVLKKIEFACKKIATT